jgi:hypothetical protein
MEKREVQTSDEEKKKGQTLKVKRKEGVEKTKNYLFNVTQYRDLALFHVDFQATERKT